MIATMSPLVEAFPPDVVCDAELALPGGAVLVPPDPTLRKFRRVPERLAAISSKPHDLWKTAPAPGRVGWCLTANPVIGLDAGELAAVLVRFMHIELLRQAAAGTDKHVEV